MTTLALVKFFVEAAFVLLAGYGIYREKDLIKFERKVAKYVKAFLKAFYYTVQQKKRSKVKTVKLPTYRNAEYDEMLASLNKGANKALEDVLVA